MAKEWKYRYRNAKKDEEFNEFINWSHDELVTHILELRSAIDEMQQELDKAGNEKITLPKTDLTESNFKQEWSYPTKIAFLLTINHKPLTSKELSILLVKLDNHFRAYKLPTNILTVNLNRAVKSGRIKKIKIPGIHNLYYALPEWVDKEGNVKKELNFEIKTFE